VFARFAPGTLTLTESSHIVGTGWSARGRRVGEVTMPVIVVTRLRLRDPAFFDEFFASALAVVEQAQNSAGNLGADVLAEANSTYWTRTAWRERDSMNAFVGSEPHLYTMDRIDEWCDEATFADWEQASADLPDWQDGYGHLLASGQAASLTNATDAHHTRDFPAPVVPS
jgi:heme-degrading monooxygenase HmoA